ncbi:unnamed protein product [Cochlearia groenlandica]
MRKLFSQRLFKISKTASSQSFTNCRISSSSLSVRSMALNDHGEGEAKIDPEPGDSSISRRFIHGISVNRNLKLPILENLMDKLREIDMSKDRVSPPPERSTEDTEDTVVGLITVRDAKKLLRAAEIEVVKKKLMETERSWISYSDFVSVCNDSSSSSSDASHGVWIAKMLDDSGNVIVLGDYVCLRPDQVTKSIEGLLPLPKIRNLNDPRRKELKELEAIKAIIDGKAHSLVKKELWAGLGYLIVQTAAFMRLTFWELTWDVMEPICFYVTSVYFMAGYAFFLRTSKEPSFEGFYQSRFEAKQRKLMKSQEFNVGRYYELKKLFNLKPSLASVSKNLGTLKS